jgi:hypothetical protein
MPWQRQAWDIGLEYDIDDRGRIIPAYREVIVTVMRQNGKSLLTFAVIGHRCTLWPDQPRRAVYTAQDGQMAASKIVDDVHPLYWSSPPFRRLLNDTRGNRGLRLTNGKERIEFATGSYLRYIGSGEEAGHGLTDTSLAIVDESFADVDDRREQALLPSMATVADAQTWNVSTAGTDASVFLRRKIEMGRAAATAGVTSGVAYIEYSIPEDADIDDPRVWWDYMPALGWTIGEDVVSHARRSMVEGKFRRAFGNQWTTTDEREIPEAVWDAVQGPASPDGMLRFAVEVDVSRESAGIVVSGDNNALELIEYRQGVSWIEDELPSRVTELAGRHGGVVRIDAGGPAGYLLPRLENAGVMVEKFTTGDVTKACAAFYDALADRRLSVRRNDMLDAAVASAQKRRVGESWAWNRAGSGVLVMAMSLAAWRDGTPQEMFVY